MAEMLYHTLDRRRYFLVPDEVALSGGAIRLRSFSLEQRSVSEEIERYEIEAEEALCWIDRRFREAMAGADEAFEDLVRRASGPNRPAPGDEVPISTLYTELDQVREAAGQLLSWLGGARSAVPLGPVEAEAGASEPIVR